MLSRIYQSLISRALRFSARHSTIAYWQMRALFYGRQSVLHTGNRVDDYDAVTRKQQMILLPLLRDQLFGTERTVLDFGCGPGRFTVALAELTGGMSVGVDPIQSLIRRAPRGNNTEYYVMRHGKIPLRTESVDLVWVCLVLGGIVRDDQIRQAVAEIERCLKPGGLLFLAENTADAVSADYWCFRTVKELDQLFPSIRLCMIGEYVDQGQPVSVLAGRKEQKARGN